MMIKRSVVISGHATSILLEPEFWEIVDLIRERRKISLGRLIETIENENPATGNLTSRLRVFCLKYSAMNP